MMMAKTIIMMMAERRVLDLYHPISLMVNLISNRRNHLMKAIIIVSIVIMLIISTHLQHRFYKKTNINS